MEQSLLHGKTTFGGITLAKGHLTGISLHNSSHTAPINFHSTSIYGRSQWTH